MPLSVLVTQCLQNDFVAPIERNEPLPNALHVGREESRRLLGADPHAGAVAQLLAWARAQDPEQLAIVHIRDWHDPADPHQAAHLARFGSHCLKGTTGAAFVLGLDDVLGTERGEHVVDATGLNDFEGTSLGPILERLLARADGALRVGVVGVWTEAKVTFLLYDLLTRFGLTDVATCSALTASSSRNRHFAALDQLRRILGVQVHDTVGDFTSWLLPMGVSVSVPVPPGACAPRLTADTAISEEDRALVGVLYRDAAEVDLTSLSGGFSGALVFKASSRDPLGHVQAPSVLKLGRRSEIGKERVAFEQVEDILGNSAPSVRGFVDLGERAAIKYSFAAMGQGAVRTFKSLYESGAPQDRVDAVLHTVFGEILAPFFAAAQYDRLPLLASYQFSPRWAQSVARNVEAVAGVSGTAESLQFPGGISLPNLVRFYDRFLPARPTHDGESHFVSWVHGDLNGANILLDARDNVWLIDFAHTARTHVLKDLAKLENDLLYIYTPLTTEADLADAVAVSQALRAVRDLREELPVEPPVPCAPPLRRAWATLRTLRAIVARECREDRDPTQLRVALLRYAAHTLSFEESNPLQRRWALAAACGHAEDVERALLASDRLRVDFIELGLLPGPGRLGLTICPGRRDRGRDLAADLAALRDAGATDLVTLVTREELEWAGVPHLAAQASAAGMAVTVAPIPDQAVPTLAEARALVGATLDALRAGRTVVAHCMGGLGRSGLVAACCLVAVGLSPPDAVAAVRRARGPRAVETTEQERFVATFAGV